MAGVLGGWVTKKIFGEALENAFGTEDPYFESVPVTRMGIKTTKKVRKALPPGISVQDAKVLTKVKRRAYRLDQSLFTCCGIKFGWSAVIGLVPAFGDMLDAFMAVMVLRTCQQVEGGLPASVQSKMVFNIVIDFLIGIVPFIGDLADAVFRANTRNAAVLEDHLRKKGRETLRMSGVPIPDSDPSDPEVFDRTQNNDSPGEYTNQEPVGQAPMQPSRTAKAGPSTTVHTTTNTTTNKSGSSWFGLGKKSRQPDVESGVVRREDQSLPALPQQPARGHTIQKTRR